LRPFLRPSPVFAVPARSPHLARARFRVMQPRMHEPSEDPTIYEVIRDEHGQVSDLLDALSREADLERREELYAEARDLLERHARAEETVFYDVLRQRADTRALVEQALAEHAEMRRLIGELDVMDTDDEGWDDGVAALVRAVKEHVRGEETRIFDAVDDLLDDEQARTLAETFEAIELRVEPEDEDEEGGRGEPEAAA
ncbi:MAG TPA: hemerythrin domain-containing protein, partial [Nannocystis sp.]